MSEELGAAPNEQASGDHRRFSRRRMIGYLIAAPTLVTAASLRPATARAAGLPSPQFDDTFDLADLLNQAAAPTSHMIAVVVNEDGTVSFALPRAEVGQGITTASAVVIADELDLPLRKVKITLADARPELMFNQLTAASNTMHSIYEPLRTAAAAARQELARAAAEKLGARAKDLRIANGVITAPDGSSATFGELAASAASSTTRPVDVALKPRNHQTKVGKPTRRIDARDAVTGRKQFAMDLKVPNALPTMLCRPPTINGTAKSVLNQDEVEAMPGVTDVAVIPHTPTVPGGVAVRAKTFGQCIDAVRALKVEWDGGSVDEKTEESVENDLRANELPLTPAAPGTVLEEVFTFPFRPGDPLEPNCAVADVRADRAEIWSSLKSPIWAQQQIADALGLSRDAVTVHVCEGGGSFGRHLFCDAAFEAATVSRAMNKPVKLMWHRTDSFRQGRAHPMAISRVRVVHSADQIISFDQRHTSVSTDFTQGLGDAVTAMSSTLPEGNFLGLSQTLFNLTAEVPYNFGPVSQLLNEIYEYNTFNTSSVRNVYNPEVCTATELMVDQAAKSIGVDPYQLRRDFSKDDRMVAVIDKVAKAGRWGRTMKPGTAQGIATHREYKGRAACLAEIDCRPKTVNRKVRKGYTGPRVTKLIYAVDVGLPINPLGLEAQMIGGAMDGIAQALSYSLHLNNGVYAEGSWDDAHYTRQWNVPPEVKVFVMPRTTDEPGGAGEFGVAATMAAVACAYARATGTLPTRFPINHDEALDFEPFPTQPPIPQSPRDGLTNHI